MVEVFFAALADLLSVQHLLYMLVGVLVGLCVGIFPGLGGIAGLSLLVPFLFGLDNVSALAMLIGLVAVIPTSDTFSSVLMGIPGSSASQATVLDGFPLAKNGEAARALSAAFISSLFGGVVGAIILTGFVLIARPLILMFGSAELFMLSLFGLSMVAVLAGRSLPKGLAACALGLGIGSLGGAPATGEFRMVYDIHYLYDGIPLVIVGLGLFAIPEIVDLLRADRSIAQGARIGTGWFKGIRDWWANLFLSVRCAGLGCLIGAIPGLGGSVVDWIAYGHAVQTTKDTSRFGKGDIRGVIAPESSNNAMQGGAMLPTLMFGIPGSGAMAVFLGGMALVGLEPGPSMVGADLNVTYAVIWSLAIANIMGAGLCIMLAQPISRLTLIPFQLLAPFMIVVVCFAAFQATRALEDLIALLLLGMIGILMKRFGWPRPALLIGFVLAPQAENYFYQAVQFYGFDFISRPGVIVIGILTIISVAIGLRNRVDDSGSDSVAAHAGGNLSRRMPQILFALFVAGLFLTALIDSMEHSFLGGIFTMGSSIIGLALTLILVVTLVVSQQGHASLFDTEAERGTGRRGLWEGLLWITGLVALSALVGFYLAMLAFFPLFLRVRARASWLKTAILTIGIAVFILVLANALSLNFPRGLLQDAYDLPWPFR
ncbi:tripartite tricarboxylate transporter permease [Polymorphum gilvum]|uniref:DUF112 domain-containing protein n=1 Tax=Polymorphum gilvum (strain LMG 25793 / CGMCC 1.9160 / SL003B-26A1) TaxID=991905 RepID=F2J3Z2_POLGS|nr:tripartite tricarboxylate transporter permease [Polymorphum gilvum]ADZ68974.1 hypothetical protein SL003B_0541 [Polymorphum gilvum SL003B-26A1]